MPASPCGDWRRDWDSESDRQAGRGLKIQESETVKKQQVLFLCTGNYYRSRFAEELFNRLALPGAAGWQASSRALAENLVNRNVGPISPHTLDGLAARQIDVPFPRRFPRALQSYELDAAQHVVALNEREHRPMIAQRFPDWVNSIEYWAFEDVDIASPAEILPRLETAVRDLIERLMRQV
ncbi:MAG: low molecular weight phosphatase family protein [Planctomycetes bacterium]|nr:low molecular weight phosphatase family protein [Planctomycetota bacterium]